MAQPVSIPLPADLRLHVLCVTIESGHNLIACDFNGKSDPYVLASIGGKTFKTKIVQKSLDPVWNESTNFAFLSADKAKELVLEVFDEDKKGLGKDDSMGVHKMDVSSFYTKGHQGMAGNVTLTGVKHGEIKIKVDGRLILPTELERRIESLTNTTNANVVKIQEQDGQIDEMTQINNDLKREKNELESNQAQLKETIQGLDTQITDLKKELSTLDQTITVVSGDIDKEKKRIEDANARKERDTKANEGKLKSIEELEGSNEELRIKINGIKETIQSKSQSCQVRSEEIEATLKQKGYSTSGKAGKSSSKAKKDESAESPLLS